MMKTINLVLPIRLCQSAISNCSNTMHPIKINRESKNTNTLRDNVLRYLMRGLPDRYPIAKYPNQANALLIMNKLGILESSSKNNKDNSAKTNIIHLFNLKTINEND